MIHLVIEDGVVTNRIVTDENTEILENWVLWDEVAHAGVDIGYLYDGENFTKPPVNLTVAAYSVRRQRDALLAESDVCVLPDRWARLTPEQQAAWGDYRQALRDLPTQPGFPLDIQWPVKPE